MTPLLELSSVTKSFGAVRALRGVSFDLLPGEVHALLGENGAGKSTLIGVVTGAHAPDAGTLRVAGREAGRLDPAAARALGIACIHQQPALLPDLSVAENLWLRLEPPRAAARVDPAAREARARALLDRIGADIDPRAEAGSLSMPRQQLVEIACAVGSGARILLMDEPTASLTRSEQARLFALVRELRASGVGIVYISHRLEEILALADRVTVLRDGESVGTRRVADPDGPPLDVAALVRMMVGREVSALYPPSSGTPGDTVLRLRGVGCSATGVHDVSMELRAGEVVGLAGLVGAGRTELAHVLFGLTPADSGAVELDGRPVEVDSPSRAIALGIASLPEDRRRHGVVGEMSVSANLSLAALPRLFPRGWIGAGEERRRALDAIRDLGVKTSGPDAPVRTLSGGNQQKVAIGRWLATGPRVLVLDEPTQGVDVGAKGEIHRIVRDLASRGMAVLMISSDLPEVLGMSDRILVMRGGTLVAELPAGSGAEAVMSAALGLGSGEEAA